MNGSAWWERLLTGAAGLMLVIVGVNVWLARGSLTRADWAQVSLLAALVLVTMHYSRAADRQARASVEMAEASLQPVVVLGRQEVVWPKVGITALVERQETIGGNTTVYNAGNGPAVNLRFVAMGPDRFQAKVAEGPPGLAALGPGEIFRLSLGQSYDKMGWVGHDLCVEYGDVAGRRWRSGLVLKRIDGEQGFAVEGLFYERIAARGGRGSKFARLFGFLVGERGEAPKGPAQGD